MQAVIDVSVAAERPNILWISLEDISPNLGCYGDEYAVTPNIDRLAAEGCRYTQAFSHAGVCAPTRSGIITGMYPTSIGTHYMRCKGVPPSHVKCFTEYLRSRGYYCTNDNKTDYNFDSPLTAWDDNRKGAHWRNRPSKETPFFCVINLTTTHESQIRLPEAQLENRRKTLSADELHDPAKAPLPPYYPDTPVVRRDVANYYDNLTWTDREVGRILKQLADDGLADSTIVFFWGDHGWGMPRGKRWIYDSGIRVPLVVRWPGQLQPGSASDELVAFVDLAPTMLSLAGAPIPKHLQGQAFLGEQKAPPREYIYAARDRMDETLDI
ncbi:MAG TPA: sulfatase, partial [Pirellulaceae bacterium]|nr:sulfatase [Pirellulaceae bacterium]